MSDYDFYYWSVPFRGQFVRAVLAFAGKSWTEFNDDAILKLMNGPVSAMPVPFMGPPMLIDKRIDFAIAEMPAIVLYLGETLNLLPATPALRALTIKTVNDANDVIDEISLNGGRDMWTEKVWQDFGPRLIKWMSLWEETGKRNGLKRDSGFLLGGETTGIADVVTATLWTTLTDRFWKIDAVLQEAAPLTAALSRRVSALPQLAKLAAKARLDYGDAYCGGKVGVSMKTVLNP
ncbi:MAG TPA: glutathione S-transferase [Devosia sp.]|nr:glutathione S-transferase [Devosia sp.]